MKADIVTRDYIRNFFQLDDSEQDKTLLDYIVSHLVLKEYTHNSYICRIGDEANDMFFIESGTVIVRDKDDKIIDEMQAGRYFGEYAAITGGKRMAEIQAMGEVQVYALDKDILVDLTRQHPAIYGLFLKKVYEQSSEKYRKLVRMLNSKRGQSKKSSRKGRSLGMLFLNYYVVFLVFLIALLFAPDPAIGRMHPLWLCSPIVFMVAYMVITQRALEALILSTMYIMILLSKLNFIGTFSVHLLNTIGSTVDIILIVLLMGSLTKLFSASGSINALKYIAQKKIKSAGGTLLASFLSMVLVAIDEYLSILINGACFIPPVDAKRVPREKSAMVMGMTPGALCVLSPISITGIYLTGVIAASTGERGIFLEAIRYNFGAFITIVFILLLAIGKLPLVGGLKRAHVRVKEGGSLWPPDTEINETEEEQSYRGHLLNLLLPVLVLIVSSIVAGTIEARFLQARTIQVGTFQTGAFQVNVLFGMIVTLIFCFFLYCFQRYMTPDQYFRNILFGFESMIAPITIFLIGKCFANGMVYIGFSSWLDLLVHNLIRGQVWLLPPIIFGVCTLVGALFDNPWAMYAIGMPIAAGLAASVNGNTALYISAVCAAGLIGNEIAPGDIFFIGPMLGIDPMGYYRAKLPYVIAITLLTFCSYAVMGHFG